MRRALRPFCALLLFAASAGDATAYEPVDDSVSEPVKLVRTLQFLQDVIVKGEVPSDDARRNLIALIGKRLLEAGPETWNDRRNADAALLYVLNGGDPAVLSRIPKDDADQARTQLVAAVTAYASGSMAEAQKLWDGIDVSSLSVGLVGPAALVKANLLFEADPAQALHFADIARLESPGTLVEEAAIRRGIEIAARLGDAGRFEFYTVSYATRFPRSMYNAAFRKRLSDAYLAVATKSEAGKALKLNDILAPLGAEDRRQIFLEIARSAVVQAKMPVARTSAEDAAALSAPDSGDMLRAEFYRAAARAISADPGDARRQLEALPAEKLPPEDRELLAAVVALVGDIQRWPEPTGEPPEDNGTSNGVDEIAVQARSVMAAVAATMTEVDK